MIRAALPLLLLLTACAAGDGYSDLGPGPDRDRLFVSPSGEPFRQAAGGSRPMTLWFSGADADRDGAITAAELRADAERWFKMLAGADDVIDGAEVSTYERSRLPEMLPDAARLTLPEGEASDILRLPEAPPREGRGTRGRGGFNLDGAAPYGVTGEPHPLMSADFDQSRRIDRAEFLRASDERFRLLDRAGDGRLSLTEVQAIKLPRRRALRRERGPRN